MGVLLTHTKIPRSPSHKQRCCKSSDGMAPSVVQSWNHTDLRIFYASFFQLALEIILAMLKEPISLRQSTVKRFDHFKYCKNLQSMVLRRSEMFQGFLIDGASVFCGHKGLQAFKMQLRSLERECANQFTARALYRLHHDRLRLVPSDAITRCCGLKSLKTIATLRGRGDKGSTILCV